MASIPEISHAQAVRLHLAAQGLLSRPARGVSRRRLREAVTRMRLLQIDTIHVVARSPYLVLFSRLGAYPMAWLDETLANGELAECWAHEACFVPMDDYPLHAAFREARAGHWAFRRAARMQREHGQAMAQVLEKVREDGPLRSADFERSTPRSGEGWWDWKPEKRFLEAWFALGQLMVARRERFQRVYDLSERVLSPSWDTPSSEWARERFIADAVRALGVTPARWIADYHRMARVGDAELEPLLASGELRPVRVTGWSETAYVHADHVAALGKATQGRLRATHATALSPFDPVVWHRQRASELFGFDYRLECYTPAPKRRYGYFSLPLLVRGALVGRVDAKAHRRDGVFQVRSLHLEDGVRLSEALLADLATVLQRLADWHETPRVVVEHGQPARLRDLLTRALKAAHQRAEPPS
ncbi:crosslink repair DNA glycosylase YcaQ family protein [Oleiagrimonas sp. C23AA]|uniref:winged helix-turn-helix domain-containing protein n=1 Tax=Oleiagrimonas sp. C23AA TaxID=2719047 RepID=UPI0014212A82|nr:crosslink repair DNA glycosylase YcaQ family protein [Oleiagrimonas sp. C23AA]NII10479.1 winged helix-turn-helix domain-containing protein [Oleiagrimonas sp. C23AA]